MNSEVNKLIEKRMMSGDPREDKLSLFKQQVLNDFSFHRFIFSFHRYYFNIIKCV